jgi:syntaxin-binding protein 5
MFSRFFQKSSSQQSPQEQNVMQTEKFDPRVLLHYGVPSTASILAFDRVQRLLAVGTLDGRIKVFGGDNIEGIMISPKQTSFKNLEFLENQGFLASVSSDNEIQVWDLRNRQIASALQWESTITSFSIIYGTSYMLVGTEHGLVYVLKFDSEDRKVNILPYYIPTNVISGKFHSYSSFMPYLSKMAGLISIDFFLWFGFGVGRDTFSSKYLIKM